MKKLITFQFTLAVSLGVALPRFAQAQMTSATSAAARSFSVYDS